MFADYRLDELARLFENERRSALLIDSLPMETVDEQDYWDYEPYVGSPSVFGFVAIVKDTGRHEVSTFPYAVVIEETGNPVFGSYETRFRAIFVDDYRNPTRFAFAKLYDPAEVESWVSELTVSETLSLLAKADERSM